MRDGRRRRMRRRLNTGPASNSVPVLFGVMFVRSSDKCFAVIRRCMQAGQQRCLGKQTESLLMKHSAPSMQVVTQAKIEPRETLQRTSFWWRAGGRGVAPLLKTTRKKSKDRCYIKSKEHHGRKEDRLKEVTQVENSKPVVWE